MKSTLSVQKYLRKKKIDFQELYEIYKEKIKKKY